MNGLSSAFELLSATGQASAADIAAKQLRALAGPGSTFDNATKQLRAVTGPGSVFDNATKQLQMLKAAGSPYHLAGGSSTLASGVAGIEAWSQAAKVQSNLPWPANGPFGNQPFGELSKAMVGTRFGAASISNALAAKGLLGNQPFERLSAAMAGSALAGSAPGDSVASVANMLATKGLLGNQPFGELSKAMAGAGLVGYGPQASVANMLAAKGLLGNQPFEHLSKAMAGAENLGPFTGCSAQRRPTQPRPTVRSCAPTPSQSSSSSMMRTQRTGYSGGCKTIAPLRSRRPRHATRLRFFTPTLCGLSTRLGLPSLAPLRG
jgi:hypothetical protein